MSMVANSAYPSEDPGDEFLEVRVRLAYLMSAAVVLSTAVSASAQHTPTTPLAAPRAAAPTPGAPQTPSAAEDGPASERGRQLHVAQCGFCHGSNARGGQQGPDLTRSALVQNDEGGKQLGEFLKVGRPDKNMPKFDLPEKDVQDLAAFLHVTIDSVSNRGQYKILDILVGDAKRGQAYFAGAGKCASCHSAAGDLQGIASRFTDPVQLQQRLLMPRGGRRRGPQASQRSLPPFLEPTALQATVTPATGEAFTGPLVSVTDFSVVVYDTERQQLRTFLRHDGMPKVAVKDPLQAHMDQLTRWTDPDLHDVTAFLATLKDTK